jgi:hypothetical protein
MSPKQSWGITLLKTRELKILLSVVGKKYKSMKDNNTVIDKNVILM